MDESKLRAFVDEHLPQIQEAMCLGHWSIRVFVEPIEQSGDAANCRVAGNCHMRPNYNQANIRLDPAQIDDEAHAAKVLVHEMGHVLVSPYRVYREFAASMIESKSSQDAQEDGIWTFCDEQAVINIERIWLGARDYWRKGYVPEPGAKGDEGFPAAIS